MKKAASVLCLLLVFTLLLSPCCLAAGENTDTLADWNLRVAVPDGAEAVLKGSEYYLYAQRSGYIPYVMITTFRIWPEEELISQFTAYMREHYPDLQVVSPAEQKQVGGKSCYEIDYSYRISGYEVLDRRIVMTVNGLSYMFASKEIESRGMTVGTMLEDVVAGCVFLSEDGSELPGLEEQDGLSPAYLYTLKNGMPKYWLDLSGAMADCPVLHCYFRSGDPLFYETVFYLDLSEAEIGEDLIRIRKVTDARGFDVSSWFLELNLELRRDRIVMQITRDESSLAGGGEDNILSGRYSMLPAGVGLVYEYRLEDGQLKYWLDGESEDLTLHAMFRSGKPEYHEESFTLDSASAVRDGDYSIRIRKVFNSDGTDVSSWFRSLTLTEVQGAVLMNVKRDESTLAGGADDNILTGVYSLDPHSFLRPAQAGPYTGEELARQAQIAYFTRFGSYPPGAEYRQNPDGSFQIRLYETVTEDWNNTRTLTCARYTVDEFGAGEIDATGEPVDLLSAYGLP